MNILETNQPYLLHSVLISTHTVNSKNFTQCFQEVGLAVKYASRQMHPVAKNTGLVIGSPRALRTELVNCHFNDAQFHWG